MNSIDYTALIALGSLLLYFVSSLIAVTIWYGKSEKKKYGLERDFNHLKRNYEQIQNGLNLILRETEHKLNLISRDILEIKSKLNIK